ncbi:pyridoxal kinase protein [Rhizobium etli CFN 42]|uniref:Pyridoxal kinase protein n=1 Tax=Rhizobium etli (strain ATCC 51251 / DSM 11541 / JCM 21823 / NBRC 15573 / CFN 42) TaxID=347834 RepID=Q2K2T9_RHIEC|nr:pyridoxal kinase protein [Rhizobium etli CFN 42]
MTNASFFPPLRRVYEPAHLHHGHRRRQAGRVACQHQLVAAALDRTRKHFEHAGGGKLQRLFIIEPGQQARQENGGQQVTETIRRIVDDAMLGKKRVAAGKEEIAGTAGHHGHRRGDEHTRRPERQRCLHDCAVVIKRCSRQPGELVPVRRCERGQRNEMITNGLGCGFRHVEAAEIAHDRIADIKQFGIVLPERSDQPGDRARLGGIAEIARKHRPDFADPGRADQVVDRRVEIRFGKCQPRRTAMAGMPGQDDGRQRPNRMAECLQRKHRRPIANRATYDMAGNNDDCAR